MMSTDHNRVMSTYLYAYHFDEVLIFSTQNMNTDTEVVLKELNSLLIASSEEIGLLY